MEIPVDSGFYYMLRLHFGEILAEINSTGDRCFLIFISNETAEQEADVIYWSGANPDDSLTMYSDAILNGAEIFKLNNSGGSLAGPDSDLSPQQLTPILVLSKRMNRIDSDSDSDSRNPSKQHILTPNPVHSESYPFRFMITPITAATNNFEDNSIGVGGFGHVYKGKINGGVTMVAVKRLKPRSSQGVQRVQDRDQMNLATSYADCGEEANEPSRVVQNNEEENIRLGGEATVMNEDGTIRFQWSWEDESGSVFSDINGLHGR
ncbi:hypothetical protein TIFTF001_033075 [Ficus carica]|uniref:Protein kinase domain-containing protein n=1 Tax=Ficus carica TaxID=3494 RepID=A0AA88DYG9_FICCA|nr:hypothetical protein TIFTF001_033075 [Ficus carica]